MAEREGVVMQCLRVEVCYYSVTYNLAGDVVGKLVLAVIDLLAYCCKFILPACSSAVAGPAIVLGRIQDRREKSVGRYWKLPSMKYEGRNEWFEVGALGIKRTAVDVFKQVLLLPGQRLGKNTCQ